MLLNVRPKGKPKGAKTLLAHAVIADLQAQGNLERQFADDDLPNFPDYDPLSNPQSRR